MRKRSVYFFVVLTLLSLGLSLVPSVFSQASQTQDIKVVSWSYYFDNGTPTVVGVAQNVGQNTITNLVMQGSIIDQSGNDQGDAPGQVLVQYLAPQEEGPFLMSFSSSPYGSPGGTWGSVTISTIKFSVSAENVTSNYQYPGLTITSSSGSIDKNVGYEGAYLVNGTIKNDGSQTAQNIWVIGAFYNSTGAVIGVGFTSYLTPTSLSPSGTMSFGINELDLNQTQVPQALIIKSYSLTVQSEEPVLQGAPIVTPNPSSSTSPTSSSSTSPTSSSSSSSVNSNGSSNAAAIYAIVIVIIIIAIGGAVLVLSKRKPPKTVKEAIKARKKTAVEILSLAFFSKKSTLSLRNMSLFKYFLRTKVVYEL